MIRISAIEIDLLRGLSLLAQVIYLLGLRPRMDFGTAVAGGTGARRITREGLRTIGECDPDRGSNRPYSKPSIETVRAALQELKRRGMIEDAGCSRANGLIFFLPNAPRDESVQNMNPRMNPRMNPLASDAETASEINRIGGALGGMNPRMNPTMNPRPSGLKNNTGGVGTRARESESETVGAGQLAKALRDRYVDVTSQHPDLRGWIERGVTLVLAIEAVEIAKQSKAGQRIPARYLSPIIDRLLRQRDQPANVGRAGNETSSGVSRRRVSQTERVRREGIEYLRRIGDLADDEWAAFCDEIGESGRPDPRRAAYGHVLDQDGGDLPASVGGKDGAGRVIDVCDLAKGTRRRDH